MGLTHDWTVGPETDRTQEAPDTRRAGGMSQTQRHSTHINF